MTTLAWVSFIWLQIVLATFGLAYAIVNTKLFEKLRQKGHIFNCMTCLSFWIGMFWSVVGLSGLTAWLLLCRPGHLDGLVAASPGQGSLPVWVALFGALFEAFLSVLIGLVCAGTTTLISALHKYLTFE